MRCGCYGWGNGTGTWGYLMVENNDPARMASIFVLPLPGRDLIYAPLHHVAALVNRLAAQQVQEALLSTEQSSAPQLTEIVQRLRVSLQTVPQPKQGELMPAFLGLIPTRGCNLACAYCGFVPAGEPTGAMPLPLVRDAVEWYLDLVGRAGMQTAEVHFFGGEPFCAEEVIDVAYHAARLKAAQVGCTVRFEVVTNGAFSEERCRWAADSLDVVILSLDGPATVHDQHRRRRDGRGSFEQVARSARILSQGAAELAFRVCVTEETVETQGLPEIAAWLLQEFRPVSVCFEPLQPTAQSEAAGLSPPDGWAFARGFIQAARILEASGVVPVYTAADIQARRVSFCPVGQDVTIVSPDGTVNACYLLRRDWEAQGLDLRLGSMGNGTVHLDAGAVETTRNLNVWNKPACAGCFCKWHCAGGCHVNHRLAPTPGAYDRQCIQTRIIALRNVLKALGCEGQMSEMLGSPELLARTVLQPSDRLAEVRLAA